MDEVNDLLRWMARGFVLGAGFFIVLSAAGLLLPG